MNNQQVVKELEVQSASFMKAFEERNPDEMAMLYTEDAQLLPPNSEPIQGREGIKGFWDAVIKKGIAAIVLTSAEVVDLGQWANEMGVYALYADNGEEIDHGKYMVLWRRSAGQWHLHRDIWNSNVNPAS